MELLFRRKERVESSQPSEPCPLVLRGIDVAIPHVSIYSEHQKAKLQLYSTRLYAIRKRIYEARPQQQHLVLDWVARLDTLHQQVCTIVQEAAGVDLGSDDDTANW